MKNISSLLGTGIIALGLILTASASQPATAQVRVRDFKPLTDSLNTLVQERTSVKSYLSLRNVTLRSSTLDFYFNDYLSDIPWKSGDEKWLRSRIKDLMPAKYKGYDIGEIYCRSVKMQELVTHPLTSDGKPSRNGYRKEDPRGKYNPIVRREGGLRFDKGLSDRHIALWQSHGRYWEAKTSRWEWQRAQTWMTVEDTYTQSYVLPFLIPMLENAGAYVMTPRERDTQKYECVTDNDPAFDGERTGTVRRKGTYHESGKWEKAGTGFADAKAIYSGNDNPFRMGTARMAKAGAPSHSTARWTADIPLRGEYAVYVSYVTLPNSTRSAHYTVHHLGGETSFVVNQRMGGGTWVYLGTFEFGEGGSGYVELDNQVPRGYPFDRNNVVTADAVRFGGGMGKIARGNDDTPRSEWTTSGLPSYLEGALYNMQWSGLDTTVTKTMETDYTNDYAGRGPWVRRLSGGSAVNPEEEGLGIPFDLSFAFHSDAGTTPNDSIIGTLSIYTLVGDENKKDLPDGTSRGIQRQLADMVQTQIVDDVRATFEPKWTRRQLWNRNYSESRTPSVPSMLLELLSHQNFGDMKLGLDPSFRFTVSRSVYKGMLKFISSRYGTNYAVQPLPVNSFSVQVLPDSRNARLRWKPTPDPLEATAVPEGYILYTRVDGGAFDEGVPLGNLASLPDGSISLDVQIQAGHLYSYRIAAYNDGGISFPSEVLCAGIPASWKTGKKVLVVNNFDRIAPPAWFDTPDYAGFDIRLDNGVAWGDEINYIGEQYQYRRALPWIDDDNPGFGASFTDHMGKKVPGNTFDFVKIHASSLLGLGYAVQSASRDALTAFPELQDPGDSFSMDLLCGKQVTTTVGRGGGVPDRFEVFPQPLQDAITLFTSKGGNILVSGSNIGTDAWDQVYPTISKDPAKRTATQNFISSTLGYKWLTNYAGKEGGVWIMACKDMDLSSLRRPFSFRNSPNEEIYYVSTPDGILPAGERGSTFLRYSDTNISAGVCAQMDGYKAVSIGFPLEVVREGESLDALMGCIMRYFEKKEATQEPKAGGGGTGASAARRRRR